MEIPGDVEFGESITVMLVLPMRVAPDGRETFTPTPWTPALAKVVSTDEVAPVDTS
jgi:hypothetical protein